MLWRLGFRVYGFMLGVVWVRAHGFLPIGLGVWKLVKLHALP